MSQTITSTRLPRLAMVATLCRHDRHCRLCANKKRPDSR